MTNIDEFENMRLAVDHAEKKLMDHATDYGIKCGAKAISAVWTRYYRNRDAEKLKASIQRTLSKYCIKWGRCYEDYYGVKY